MLDTTATITNLQTVVALDLGPVQGVTPDVDRLVERMGDAVVDVITLTIPDPRSGRDGTVTEHRVNFDADRLRNTEANGMAYRLGFVAHVSDPVRLAEQDRLRAAREVAAARTLAVADANLPAARKAVAEARRSARQGFGCIYVTISLPRPWGAANVYADGRVLAPSTGRPIVELA